MRMPVTSQARNILFTRSGVAWAGWRVKGVPYHFMPDIGKVLAKSHHQALFQAVLGESLILGLSADLDPGVLVTQMMNGVDMAQAHEYQIECQANLDELSDPNRGTNLGSRAYWIFVPLKPSNLKHRVELMWQAADAQLREQLAMPKRFGSAEDIAAALEVAQRVHAAIPPKFEPTPASAEELKWIVKHFLQRGLGQDGSVPSQPDYDAGAVFDGRLPVVVKSGTELVEPLLDEGGQGDVDGVFGRLMPYRRRFLKVVDVESPAVWEDEGEGLPASYQVMLAMTGTPNGGFVFPGVEFIAQLDRLPVDADFAIRLTSTPAAKVRIKNKRAENALADQYGQQGDLAGLIGGANDLDQVAEAIMAYDASLNMSESEVETQATIIFTVSGSEPDIARAKAQYLVDFFKAKEFVFSAPVGGQEDLWWAQVPGVPTSRLVRELAQITTGRELAFGVPLVANELGDPTGFRIADNISTGRRSPVLFDPEGNIRSGTSGSMAAVGDKGSGKSTFVKTAAGHVIDRGGILFCIDRTPAREYATFAASLVPDKTVVLDILSPQYSLDPLRLFSDRKEAVRMTMSLASVLLAVPATSDNGALLNRILTTNKDLRSLPALIEHLREGAGLTDARRDRAELLADRFEVFSESDLGAVYFDESLPPFPMTATASVILTDGLELPTRDELMNESLKKEMSVEKIMGRSIYALCAGLGKNRCFSDRSVMAVFLVDECYHMTTSPEAEQDIIAFLRDDRKHKAAIWFGGHSAKTDLGSETLRGLIPIRYVFKTTDDNLAKANLDWLGLRGQKWEEEVTTNLSPKIKGTVPEHRRGEALTRDGDKRFGKVQILPPRNPQRREAVFSTPPEREAV